MSWQSYFPTKVFFGAYAVVENAAAFGPLGKRALIVTGRGGSARRTGALDDLLRVLTQTSIKWEIFDQVEANPSIETARKGARQARIRQADFIIGIGGGSPLDAAKAIAVLTANEVSDEELFTRKFERVLPIVAIPTTAGTGSEVTPYSILTNPATEAKQRILSPRIIPQLACLDPRYTMELPARVTWDTAIDAYSHNLESFLCTKATPFTDLLAREGMRILGAELKNLAEGDTTLTWKNRSNLLYGSLLGGLAISITGTTIPHSLGFNLTYYKNIPHGRANGMIMPAYMHFNRSKSNDPKIGEALQLSGFNNLREFADVMRILSGDPPPCDAREKNLFIAKTMEASNINFNLAAPEREDIEQLLESVLNH